MSTILKLSLTSQLLALPSWVVAESLCDLQLRKEDYHLPTLGPKIIELGKEVSLGKGFHLIRY